MNKDTRNVIAKALIAIGEALLKETEYDADDTTENAEVEGNIEELSVSAKHRTGEIWLKNASGKVYRFENGAQGARYLHRSPDYVCKAIREGLPIYSRNPDGTRGEKWEVVVYDA